MALEVLEPTGAPVGGRGVLSPRLDTLDGKTIGILWNGRPAGDKIFNRMMEILKERHKIKEVVFRDKPFLGNIAPKDVLDDLIGKCDAVITGVGD